MKHVATLSQVGLDLTAETTEYLQVEYANYIIFGASGLSLAYAAYCFSVVYGIKMTKDQIKCASEADDEIGLLDVAQNLDDSEDLEDSPSKRMTSHRGIQAKLSQEHNTIGKSKKPITKAECFETMLRISELIKTGSNEFLKKEYTYLAVFCTLFAVLIYFAVDCAQEDKLPYTTVAFLVGAITSMLCGYIGMAMAVYTNVRTTWSCCNSIHDGFHVAFKGGKVLGFALVGLAILVLQVLLLVYKSLIIKDNMDEKEASAAYRTLFEMLAGYGLGGSTVALFGRVGGGIYTKAADVGADLAGKVCEGLEEDSPDNPGTIADNVGDNVGDIAGMGADLFGSLAESTCAALVISAHSPALLSTPDAAYFPIMVSSVGIVASFFSVMFVRIGEVTADNVETKLKIQLALSTVFMSLMLWPLLSVLPEQADIDFAGKTYTATPRDIYACVMSGLWSGLFIGIITEYFTSNRYSPVQNLVESCRMGAAPNIILGLALGYSSTIVPIMLLAVTIWVSFTLAGMYGIALAAIGMLGCLPVALAIDGYGPIADNAGGISEMSLLANEVRQNTDKLDAAGNTTAAIGKGFAIGSACLVSLALFGAYIVRVEESSETPNYTVNVLDPTTFSGLLLGAMIPYAFSALTMAAVGDAANEMITEIKSQFVMMKKGHPADPDRCVAISTKASLNKMIAPGALVIFTPFVVGMLFSKNALNGLLAGIIVSGIQIAFSFSNTGGAWDNTKKCIEAGGFQSNGALINDGGKPFTFSKKDVNGVPTDEHKAAVIGDTVGDPLKDTSGPSINILIKLSAITSLIFGGFIATEGGLIISA